MPSYTESRITISPAFSTRVINPAIVGERGVYTDTKIAHFDAGSIQIFYVRGSKLSERGQSTV